MTDLLTENARLRAALMECESEIDAYIRQEYPLDHPVHERYRERDFAANPARIALATPAPDTVQEAARVPEIAALIEAAAAATVVLAEHEPYPMPVLHNLLLKLDAVDVAILRAKEAGQ